VAGEPDVRCEVGWLDLQAGARSVNTEVLDIGGERVSAALVRRFLRRSKVAEEEVTQCLRRGLQERGRGPGAGAGPHAPKALASCSREFGIPALVRQCLSGVF
jgi:hypothetical protein